MAGTACKCDGSIDNLGTSNCPKNIKPIRGAILFPLVDSTGADAKIAISDLTAAGIQAKLQATNDRDRWHFISDIEDFGGDGRGEPIVTTFGSGKTIEQREGRRSQAFVIPNADHQWIARLKGWKCVDFGMILFDDQCQFVYRQVPGDTTNAYGLPIDNDTWVVRDMWASDADGVGRASVTFQFKNSLRDQQVYVKASEVSGTDLYSLTDVVYAEAPTVASTTVINFKLKTVYGQVQTGIGVADIEFENTTDGVDIAFASVVEGDAGTYVGTLASAQGSGDVGFIKPLSAAGALITKRRDLSPLSETSVTFP